MKVTIRHTRFGKTKTVEANTYNGGYESILSDYQEVCYFERGEDWYALNSPDLKGKTVAVITPRDWARGKEE